MIVLILLKVGSSPRGRGKPTLARELGTEKGLIPARAGKTGAVVVSQSRKAAHPRAGGENSSEAGDEKGATGSSPRGRGKPASDRGHGTPARLIPARAGKTALLQRGQDRRGAHPRAGGENGSVEIQGIKKLGSSPRGRGKPRERDGCLVGLGLIPARAGKTPFRLRVQPSRRAHPRAGGENWRAVVWTTAARGSSPRGRGKRMDEGRPWRPPRLIPARAGKTRRRRAGIQLREAHPRAGGENDSSRSSRARISGSSPRGRGKPVGQSGSPSRQGLIPARAGKTE